MENSFFVFTDKSFPAKIERFHVCTWEFNSDSSLVEFGLEVSNESLKGDEFSISIFIPWLNSDCAIFDLYNKLSIAENSKFIFNDSIKGTDTFDGGKNKFGVVHKFHDRGALCVLPIEFDKNLDKVLTVKINLQKYNEYGAATKPNVYFRFLIKPEITRISMRKIGISKSTIIYDVKINERRNIPDDQLSYFNDKALTEIKSCFFFNIIPNKYDIIFFDNSSLKNVRTLEFDAFNKYLEDKRVKKDELIVVFNKKQNSESFSFFSIYGKERVGIAQFSLAIMLNIFCGLLFFIGSVRIKSQLNKDFFETLSNLPLEIYLAILIMFATFIYFTWPTILNGIKWIKRKLTSK